jgi:hypothetical protein
LSFLATLPQLLQKWPHCSCCVLFWTGWEFVAPPSPPSPLSTSPTGAINIFKVLLLLPSSATTSNCRCVLRAKSRIGDVRPNLMCSVSTNRLCQNRNIQSSSSTFPSSIQHLAGINPSFFAQLSPSPPLPSSFERTSERASQ